MIKLKRIDIYGDQIEIKIMTLDSDSTLSCDTLAPHVTLKT